MTMPHDEAMPGAARRQFLAPRHWPSWVAIGVLAAVRELLPFSAQVAVGRWLGRMLYRVGAKPRRTAQRNIELCFPELDAAEVRALTRRHFESLGMQLLETNYCWGKPLSALTPLVEFEGFEHLKAALSSGRGVILVTGHFAALEITGLVLGMTVGKLHAMYRPQRANPLFDAMIYRGRSRAATMVDKYAVRKMISALRDDNRIVLYLADQAYRRKRSAVLPFFSQPAMTNTSVSHIARVSSALVVPFLPLRREDGRFSAKFLPALEDFPSDDALADTLRVNRVLEEHIRSDPSQYLWVHKRFKGLPPEYPDAYACRPRA